MQPVVNVAAMIHHTIDTGIRGMHKSGIQKKLDMQHTSFIVPASEMKWPRLMYYILHTVRVNPNFNILNRFAEQDFVI